MKNIEVTSILILEWYWIKSTNIVESVSDVATLLSQLNTIKIDVKDSFIVVRRL